MTKRMLNPAQFLYHGTPYGWKGEAQASYDRPLHVATDKDYPGEKAFEGGITGEPSEDWEAMQSGHIKQFRIHPQARVHYTDTPHADAILPEHEQAHVRQQRYDITMFHGGLGIVYNPKAIHHVRDLHWKDVRGSRPEDEMEWMHGEDWRDYV